MKGNVNYLELANSPLMWVSAAIAVGIVVFQSVLFFRKSLKAAKEIGIEQEKINMAIKSSAISSIGPSIVILVTMISLIVSMGAPVSWIWFELFTISRKPTSNTSKLLKFFLIQYPFLSTCNDALFVMQFSRFKEL